MPPSGAFLENLLLCHLDVMRQCIAPRPEVYFYRTAEGAEVDVVIEHKRRLLPIEVKASTRVTRDDVRHLERFCEEHGARWGMVAYAGDELFAMSPRVVAVPVGMLA